MSEKNMVPSPGDEVFDIHGRAASYVARVSAGHIVEPLFEHDSDDGPSFGRPETWNEFFLAPPVQKLHAEVGEAQKKLNEARQQLNAVREQRREEDAQYTRRAAMRKQFDQLQKLDDYIAGKITHFVVRQDYRDSVSIEAFDSFIKSDEDKYDRKLRLLSLYGDSKGNLSWHVDRYSDGSSSGSSGYHWPATSYEEAMQKAAEWLDARYGEWRKATDHTRNKSATYAACAIKLGLPVPDDIAADAARVEAIAGESRLKSAREAFAKAQTELNNAIKATGAA